jgi:hypothetical protein
MTTTTFEQAKVIVDGKPWLCIQTDAAGAMLEGIKDGKTYTCTIAQYRKKRSLDANAYFWVLADKVAAVLGITKEEVYRKAVHDVGVFEIVPIREDALDQWRLNWESGGLGRICEALGDSKLDGYVKTINYFGSSVYDTTQMKRLIDWIVDEAHHVGVETLTPQEIAQMTQQWGEREEK